MHPRDSMPSTKIGELPKNPTRNQVKQSPNITRATLQQLKELTYLSQDSDILQEVTFELKGLFAKLSSSIPKSSERIYIKKSPTKKKKKNC